MTRNCCCDSLAARVIPKLRFAVNSLRRDKSRLTSEQVVARADRLTAPEFEKP